MRRSAFVAVVLAVLVGTVPTVGAGVTTVSDAVPGRAVIYAQTTFDLATVGYTQSEHFLRGTATAYAPTAPLSTDGKWSVAPASEEPYTTRVVVNRPARDRDFSGTVFVEWLNVSGGADASPDWTHTHAELIRRGHAWVGVSAQAVGMNALKAADLGDPQRYASLAHPGDSYSYDIYSQAGRAVRDQSEVLLGGLRPRYVIATGESQSAIRLTTYVNAVHPVARVYDGFVVHSRFGSGAPLRQPPLPAEPAPSPSLIRDDLDVPVLVFQTENDALGARQADTRRFRLWEVAGTAHYDTYGLIQGATDDGDGDAAQAWFASMRAPTNRPSTRFSCDRPINAGPQTFVLRAAVAAMDRWVRGGAAPPRAPRFETVSLEPLQFAVDDIGNVRGGIRTPAVDAPVATLSGLGQSGTSFCFLFGTTVPLTVEQLTARYGTPRAFVTAWDAATTRAVKAGFLLPEDARDIRAAAAAFDPRVGP